MQTRTYHLEFLTPCFCAGADPVRAELRPSAIRGQLRWWFRCLGGSPTEERAQFGGVQGSEPAGSRFSVRVLQQPSGGQIDWFSKIPQQGIVPSAYLLGFFCGRTGRLASGGALPPKSSAAIQLTFRQNPSARLEQAVRIFFSMGALGFRATRAAGAFATTELPLSRDVWKTLTDELRQAGLTVGLVPQDFGDNWIELLSHAGSLLKNRLRGREGLRISAGRNGSKPNALGSAEPRQASALHLRPVRIDGRLRLALIEAPHGRILGADARRAHGDRGPILRLAGLAR